MSAAPLFDQQVWASSRAQGLRAVLQATQSHLEARMAELEPSLADTSDDELAYLLRATEELAGALKATDTTLRQAIAQRCPFGQPWVLEGVATFEWRGGKKRTAWDRAGATSAVVRAGMLRGGIIDPDSGEVVLTEALPAVQAVVDALTTAARLEFRAGTDNGTRPGLKALGLDPADYCTEEAGQATVTAIWPGQEPDDDEAGE